MGRGELVSLGAWAERLEALGIGAMGFVAETSAWTYPQFCSKVEGLYPLGLEYLRRQGALRQDLRALLEGCRGLISMAFPLSRLRHHEGLGFARFCSLLDYHKLLRERVGGLLVLLREQLGDFGHRICVDSSPVLEREWAVRAGLGWIGKNRLLIHPELGSHFVLAELLLDIDPSEHAALFCHRRFEASDFGLSLEQCLMPGGACGVMLGEPCSRCIQACPCRALSEGGAFEPEACMAYISTHAQGQYSAASRALLKRSVWGCDICQDSCPWNQLGGATSSLSAQVLSSALEELSLEEALSSGVKALQRRLFQTPLSGSHPKVFQRNLCLYIGERQLQRYRGLMETCALQHASALVREAASWALARLNEAQDED